MKGINIYFSDFFGINEDIVETYGAVNISLINDMPLFVDPFLLFNSEKESYQKIHNDIILYLLFLQEQAEKIPNPPQGMLTAWYHFPEIKQTWLGFSLEGNSGKGLGNQFAINLHRGLRSIFKDFGKETITKSSHLEKLCLISPLVGRDKISDLTTNFTKKYILEYTENFAAKYLEAKQCKKFVIPKVEFSFKTMTWKSGEYLLPCYNNDYVLLTPRDMLTRDDTFINRTDMIRKLQDIAPSVEDSTLRFALNQYLSDILPRKKKEMSKKEKENAATLLIHEYPELIDYYIKYKEENEEQASSVSKQVVQEVIQLFDCQLRELVRLLFTKTEFYSTAGNSYDEAYRRVMYLKSVIENMDGYRIFYVNGKPIRKESDLQIMYRLVWYASDFDVNREVNNGRGPVDFKVSKGSCDSTLVEFKLASNSKLRKNLENQVEIYKKANNTDRAIKVILYFTEEEYAKVINMLNDLNLNHCNNIVLINAIGNKPSASTVG